MSKSFYELHQIVHGMEPPESVVVGESQADLIRPGRGFIGAFDYTMQLQVGCPGGCLYCYVPASKWLTPPDVRRQWGFLVRNKQDVASRFEQHIHSGELADKTLYWSGVTDPYAASPLVTRSIWQILGDSPLGSRPRRVAVQSRFGVERDVDVIGAYYRTTVSSDGGPPVVVSFSLGTDRNEVIRQWERATPSFERRMKSIKKLCSDGIYVVVTLSPFGPWQDLRGTLVRLLSWGVQYVTVLFFKTEEYCASTPPGFLNYLMKEWPDLLDPGWQKERLHEIESVFGMARVLTDQTGFSSLVAPQYVFNANA